MRKCETIGEWVKLVLIRIGIIVVVAAVVLCLEMFIKKMGTKTYANEFDENLDSYMLESLDEDVTTEIISEENQEMYYITITVNAEDKESVYMRLEQFVSYARSLMGKDSYVGDRYCKMKFILGDDTYVYILK